MPPKPPTTSTRPKRAAAVAATAAMAAPPKKASPPPKAPPKAKAKAAPPSKKPIAKAPPAKRGAAAKPKAAPAAAAKKKAPAAAAPKKAPAKAKAKAAAPPPKKAPAAAKKRAAPAKRSPPPSPTTDEEEGGGGKAGAATTKRAAPAPKRARPAPQPKQPKKAAAKPATPAKPVCLPAIAHPSLPTARGEAWVCGAGDCGQLGLGEDIYEAPRPRASPLPNGLLVRQVACGGMHTLALATDGSVFSAGVNDEGALGRPTAGELWDGKAAEEEDGDEGGGGAPQPAPAGGAPAPAPPSLPRGDPYLWGAVPIPRTHGRVVQLSAGDSHSIALTSRGAVWGWGTYRDGSGVYGFAPGTRIAREATLILAPTSADARIVKVVSGADHTLALTAAGSILSWGTAGAGALGRVSARAPTGPEAAPTLLVPALVPLPGGSKPTRATDVFAGTYTSFAVTAAAPGGGAKSGGSAQHGRVLGWGLNNYTQLGVATRDAAPAWAPLRIPSFEAAGVRVLRGGQHHTLAIAGDGKTLLAVGRPTYGRLGVADAAVSSDEPSPLPLPVTNLVGPFKCLAAGLAVSGAVTADGSTHAWGFGDSGQLGQGDGDVEGDAVTPAAPRWPARAAGRKAVALDFGGQHTVVVLEAEGGEPTAVSEDEDEDEGGEVEAPPAKRGRTVTRSPVGATAAPAEPPAAAPTPPVVEEEAEEAPPAPVGAAAPPPPPPAAAALPPAAEEVRDLPVAMAAEDAVAPPPAFERQALPPVVAVEAGPAAMEVEREKAAAVAADAALADALLEEANEDEEEDEEEEMAAQAAAAEAGEAAAAAPAEAEEELSDLVEEADAPPLEPSPPAGEVAEEVVVEEEQAAPEPRAPSPPPPPAVEGEAVVEAAAPEPEPVAAVVEVAGAAPAFGEPAPAGPAPAAVPAPAPVVPADDDLQGLWASQPPPPDAGGGFPPAY